MLDYIQSLEDAAENHLFEMTKGLPKGKFRCGCGRVSDLDGALSSSENPYSEPICRHCVAEIEEKKE